MGEIKENMELFLSEADVRRIAKERGCEVKKITHQTGKGRPFLQEEFCLAKGITSGATPETLRASFFVTKLKGKKPQKRRGITAYIPKSALMEALSHLGIRLG